MKIYIIYCNDDIDRYFNVFKNNQKLQSYELREIIEYSKNSELIESLLNFSINHSCESYEAENLFLKLIQEIFD